MLGFPLTFSCAEPSSAAKVTVRDRLFPRQVPVVTRIPTAKLFCAAAMTGSAASPFKPPSDVRDPAFRDRFLLIKKPLLFTDFLELDIGSHFFFRVNREFLLRSKRRVGLVCRFRPHPFRTSDDLLCFKSPSMNRLYTLGTRSFNCSFLSRKHRFFIMFSGA